MKVINDSMIRNFCILCGVAGEARTFNDIAMFCCLRCGLVWQARPETFDAYYEGNIVDLSEKKIEARRANARERLLLFKKYANLNNLLDIGCGDGIFLKTIQDDGYKNVLGVDLNKSAVAFAQSNGVKALVGGAEETIAVISAQSVHTAVLFHVIEHLVDPLEMLRRLYFAMPTGGKIILETPNMDSYIIRASNYRHELIYAEHIFYFNEKNLRALVELSGFHVACEGRRDFNQNNLSIKESLTRLGLERILFARQKNGSALSGVKKEQADRGNSFTRNIIKDIVRTVLNKIVILLGRLNYIWIVAEK